LDTGWYNNSNFCIQAIVDVIDFGANTNIAVNAPKFHHQWLPETVAVEKGFPNIQLKNWKRKNYKFERRDKIGRIEMIVVDPNSNYHAVADGRGDDSVSMEKINPTLHKFLQTVA
jgi:gamma-glutamyltranspeptidase/glutathione hydrolase